jgi:drug/metabolite transporter (DMT)-like permease
MPDRQRLGPTVLLALLAVYLVWGSTYLAIRITLESYPPLSTAGVRFIIAGLFLFSYLKLRGEAAPSGKQWASAAVIGTILLLGGNGGVVYAEQWVSSGIAATVIATTPIWMVVFSSLFGRRSGIAEWAGVFIGFSGVVLLGMRGELQAHPNGTAALLMASMFWSFGSAWSRRLPMPKGMMSGAAQMIAGGAAMLAAGLLSGEQMPGQFPLRATAAVVYLIVFGSLIGFTSYLYLLQKVSPALATSYGYVNPLVAVILGMFLGGEQFAAGDFIAMAVILAGVVLVLSGSSRKGS